jgi:hypothetical protein
VDIVGVKIGPARALGLVVAADELAVVAERLVAGQGVVPQKAGDREGQRVAPLVGVAARELTELFL